MKHVLLVRDRQDRSLRRKAWLERSGFDVHVVEDADACFEEVERHLPDIVLVDILLPGVNGFDLCRQLRHRHSAEELPIFLFDGIYQGPTFEREAVTAGAQRYLSSRIESRELVKEVCLQLNGEAVTSKAADPRSVSAEELISAESTSSVDPNQLPIGPGPS